MPSLGRSTESREQSYGGPELQKKYGDLNAAEKKLIMPSINENNPEDRDLEKSIGIRAARPRSQDDHRAEEDRP